MALWKGGGDVTDEEWIPQHRILYFRRKGNDGEMVWHRGQRLDNLFGSGIQDKRDQVIEERDPRLEQEGKEQDSESLGSP